MKKIICICMLFFAAVQSFSASMIATTVSGYVKDASNGEALIGANVFFKDTYLGCSSNNSGYFVIPDIPAGKYTLVVSMLGYKMYYKNITINRGQNIQQNVILEEEPLLTEEIVVTADSVPTVEKLFRKSISKIEMSPQQLKRVPQIAEADLMRTLVTLPGIVPLSDYSSALYVRGGTPDQNLILLDGTDVYNPEHAFGLFSTFNTDAIKHVEIHKGGFGPEYGGRLSSVLDVTNLDGNREEFECSTSISMLSAKTTMQMPVGKKGSVSGSIRRTYFDKTVAKVIDDIPDYYYWDGNFKAFYEINKNNKLTLSTYGGRDALDLVFNNNSTEQTGFLYDWGNKTGSAKWTHIFSPQLFSNFWITGSEFTSNFDMDFIELQEINDLNDVTIKGNLEYYYSQQMAVKFGFEQKFLNNEYEFSGEHTNTIRIKSKPEHSVGYGKIEWTPTPLINIETGLRYNYFRSDEIFQNVEPRFSAKYRITDKANIKAATGVYYQYLHHVPRFLFADIWTTSNKFQKPSKAIHFILGYQQELAKDIEFEVETFYKDYKNLYSYNENIAADVTAIEYDEEGLPIYTQTEGVFNRADGCSYGFELLVRKNFGRINGWVGYSLSRTEYQFDVLNQQRWFAPRHDRTSTLNVVANYNKKMAGGKWTFGFNFVYSSGQPFTEPGSAYYISSSPMAPIPFVEYAPTQINNIRFPYYARLDISIAYLKQYSNWSLEPYLQIYNVGNRRNVWFVDYDYDNGVPDFEEIYMLPILPTIGFNIRF